MVEILALMMRLEGLKRTARTGWNKKPGPGDTFQARTVPEAESVADHSWSLAMFAFVIASKLRLDVKKMVTMALVHDVAECITGDAVTATFPPEVRKQAKAENVYSKTR
ncbi:MAG: HD domain-containing protein [Patescibacteria group bacterium]